jgi:hypothetical protein
VITYLIVDVEILGQGVASSGISAIKFGNNHLDCFLRFELGVLEGCSLEEEEGEEREE